VVEVYTPQRSSLLLGLLGLVGSSLLVAIPGGPARTPEAFWDPSAVAVRAALGLGFGLSAWLVLRYLREDVALDDSRVVITRVVGRRGFKLAEVDRARWRDSPPTLTLGLPGGTVVVRFEDFWPGYRRRLIHYFRDGLGPGVQEGWSDALERYAVEVAEKDTPAAYDRSFRPTWRVLLAGAAAGLMCGAANLVYQWLLGWELLPGWAASMLLDGLVTGTLLGVLLFAGLAVAWWVGRPDS
jgi:hypothetical protein